MQRKDKIKHAVETQFDLIIIGGGITGAGVLKEAAENGLKTLLIEKNDFGSGTSSKSGKLIHGGLRYLQNLQFKIVRESLSERNWLLEHYEHLVKPLEFIFPLYESKLKFRIGMILYQLMGKHKALPKYRFLNKQTVVEKFPEINTQGLKGGVSYYDGVTNDARLVTEVIFEAEQFENTHALSYIEVTNITDEPEFCSIKCKDKIDEKEYGFNGKVIVNCTGVWTDRTLNLFKPQHSKIMAPSKGVHLVFSISKLNIKSALVFSSGANDGRMFYALPWEYNTVILGTTDTPFNGSPDEVNEDVTDTEYLLNGINGFLPESDFTTKDIIYSFSGLRPLFDEKVSSTDKTRDFKIWWNSKNIISISGGKLSTFRAMAKTLLNIVVAKKTLITRQINQSMIQNNTSNIPQHILNSYSPKAVQLIKTIIVEKPSNEERVIEELVIIKAEIIFAVKYLQALKIEDIMLRRFSFKYGLNNKNYYTELVTNIGLLMQAELGWDNTTLEKEITHCLN